MYRSFPSGEWVGQGAEGDGRVLSAWTTGSRVSLIFLKLLIHLYGWWCSVRKPTRYGASYPTPLHPALPLVPPNQALCRPSYRGRVFQQRVTTVKGAYHPFFFCSSRWAPSESGRELKVSLKACLRVICPESWQSRVRAVSGVLHKYKC